MKLKYKQAFLDMACRFGETSEANRLKVGAMLVKGSFPIACGTNGQPPKWHTEICEDELGNTLPTVRHAEKACLDKLRNSHETAEGCVMFVSHSPCLSCSIEIVSSGIKHVVYKHDYRCYDGVAYLKKHGVVVEQLD